MNVLQCISLARLLPIFTDRELFSFGTHIKCAKNMELLKHIQIEFDKNVQVIRERIVESFPKDLKEEEKTKKLQEKLVSPEINKEVQKLLDTIVPELFLVPFSELELSPALKLKNKEDNYVLQPQDTQFLVSIGLLPSPECVKVN